MDKQAVIAAIKGNVRRGPHTDAIPSRPVTYTSRFKVYIVYTDQLNHDHHGLHTNNSPFVLTLAPRPEDKIALVLRGRRVDAWRQDDVEDGKWEPQEIVLDLDAAATKPLLDRYDPSNRLNETFVSVEVLSHLGRSVMLGEDGAEDAFGNPVPHQRRHQ